jgi:hypothetical protein
MSSVEALPDTPAWRQYQELKAKHPGSLLFFRLGDFYELFGDDAKDASALLGLVLTQRQGVPMCGVPFHSSQNYIARLLKAGRKIAVAEQLGEAVKGAKKLVERDVVRVVTPGTTSWAGAPPASTCRPENPGRPRRSTTERAVSCSTCWRGSARPRSSAPKAQPIR